MKRNPANKASRPATLLRIASHKAARRLNSRRKQRAHQRELNANPNAGARAIFSQPRMNGNFRPMSFAMQYHHRVARGKIRLPTLAQPQAAVGAPMERHK